MVFCPVNDRHLVIWGTYEARLLVLNRAGDAISKAVELVMDLEPPHPLHATSTSTSGPNSGERLSSGGASTHLNNEATLGDEYLLKCEFVPRSETLVCVVCGTFLKVFDVTKATPVAASAAAKGEWTTRSTTCFTLAYEDVLIRGAVLMDEGEGDHVLNTSCPSPNSSAAATGTTTTTRVNPEYSIKLILLLDSGRLYMAELLINSVGTLEEQGESYIECGEGLAFPTAGIRRYIGASPGLPGTTSLSYGDAQTLEYLRLGGGGGGDGGGMGTQQQPVKTGYGGDATNSSSSSPYSAPASPNLISPRPMHDCR
mmetsp:Transcript_6018/g.7379  ORF Transcript_6018/g.7379 Transcript_6018/m.7379 type:complete len:313 (-) Transcript_6018:381-1319(-)